MRVYSNVNDGTIGYFVLVFVVAALLRFLLYYRIGSIIRALIYYLLYNV
jgi:hypothetical protein